MRIMPMMRRIKRMATLGVWLALLWLSLRGVSSGAQPDDGWRPLGSTTRPAAAPPALLPAAAPTETARPIASTSSAAPGSLPPGSAEPAQRSPDQPSEPKQTAAPEQDSAVQQGPAAQQEAGEDKAADKTPATPPVRRLPPVLVGLRDRVRQTLAAARRYPLDATQRTPSQLIDICLPFGCRTEVARRDIRGGKINGITCLCWNYPCAGYTLLTLAEGRIAARVGYGFQQHRGQLLAMLAFARVKPDYPVRVGEQVRSVADLVEYEKRACRAGTELSWTLVGLARYAADQTWQNDLGETWSVERIVREELAQDVLHATDGGTHRLLGLSYAVRWQAEHDRPVEGEFERAAEFLRRFEQHALAVQNADGSWGPMFLAARSAGRDPRQQLYATGHVLRWLAWWLPDEPEAAVALRSGSQTKAGAGEAAVAAAWSGEASGSTDSAGNAAPVQSNRPSASLSPRDTHSLMCALHALAIYDQRVFQPADPPTAPAEGNVQAAAR